MARSSRSAGGCVSPTEGKRPSGQGQADHQRFRPGRSSSAMCTAPPSPHRPEQGRSPAAMPTIACRQSPRRRDARPGAMGPMRPCPWQIDRKAMGASLSSQQPRDGLEPGDQRAGKIDAGRQHQGQMRKQRHVGGLDRRRAAGGLAEGQPVRRSSRAPKATSRPNTSGIASSGSRAKVELTTRNSLMKMPNGGRPAMATRRRAPGPSPAPGGSR